MKPSKLTINEQNVLRAARRKLLSLPDGAIPDFHTLLVAEDLGRIANGEKVDGMLDARAEAATLAWMHASAEQASERVMAQRMKHPDCDPF